MGQCPDDCVWFQVMGRDSVLLMGQCPDDCVWFQVMGRGVWYICILCSDYHVLVQGSWEGPVSWSWEEPVQV